VFTIFSIHSRVARHALVLLEMPLASWLTSSERLDSRFASDANVIGASSLTSTVHGVSRDQPQAAYPSIAKYIPGIFISRGHS